MQFEEIVTILFASFASLVSIVSIFELMSKLMEIRKNQERSPTFEIDIKDASGNIIETKIVPSEEGENFLRMLRKGRGNNPIPSK